MSKVDIFMPLYYGDYLKDTTSLSTEEHGAYLLLLMDAWNRGGFLPNNPEDLSRIAKVLPDKWAKIWARIGPMFTVDGERVTQLRLLKELSRSRGFQERARRGGLAKNNRDGDETHFERANETANGVLNECLSDANGVLNECTPTPTPPTPTTPNPQPPADADAHAPTHARAREEAPRAGTAAAALPSAGLPSADCDAEGPPQPPVTKAELVRAICDVRRLDPERLDRATERATASLAAWCMSQDPPVSPDEARAWGAEWYSDMRRKKGAVKIGPPSIGQLSEWMARMVWECEGSAMLSRGVLGGNSGRDSAATTTDLVSPPSPDPSEAERLWAHVVQDMELRLMHSAWETQVKPTRGVALEGAVLTVEAPSLAVKGWIEERLIGVMRELLAGAAGRALDLAVVARGGAA